MPTIKQGNFFEYFDQGKYDTGIVIGGHIGFNQFGPAWLEYKNRIQTQLTPKSSEDLSSISDPYEQEQPIKIPLAHRTQDDDFQKLFFMPIDEKSNFASEELLNEIKNFIIDAEKFSAEKILLTCACSLTEEKSIPFAERILKIIIERESNSGVHFDLIDLDNSWQEAYKSHISI